MIDATRQQAQAWLAAGRPAMLVQVIGHRGSVPRETGTRMLVSADAVAGTIGGGHLELKAITQARRQLADQQCELRISTTPSARPWVNAAAAP